jgi:tripartite-type tricarboxylate transporter receptor subunit TctC
VVPFAAGGAADTIGRLYTDALTAAFGKQFYIENRVGGGGLLGTEAVARAEPDGLTLMVSGIPTHVLGPAMNKNVGFDPMRDFTHIAYFGGTPNVLVAHPSLGVASYRDFLALARRGRRRMRLGRLRHDGQLDRGVSRSQGKDQAGARRL